MFHFLSYFFYKNTYNFSIRYSLLLFSFNVMDDYEDSESIVPELYILFPCSESFRTSSYSMSESYCNSFASRSRFKVYS